MMVTDDIAMVAGREVYGFPKKMAEISMTKNGDVIEGDTKRHGIKFLSVKAKLNGKLNNVAPVPLETFAPGKTEHVNGIAYNFKYFPAPEGMGRMDYNPRLVRQTTIFRPKQVQIGEVEIALAPSEIDPWAEIEVVKTLGAVYVVGDNSMQSGKTVAEVSPMEFAPYAFLKWDMRLNGGR